MTAYAGVELNPAFTNLTVYFTEHCIRGLLAAWLVLPGSVLLAQYMGSSPQLAYWLFVGVAVTSPVVAGLRV